MPGRCRPGPRQTSVLDISELAGQRLVPGLSLRCDSPPSQAAFETQLLERLRRFDPDRPIWVRVGPAPLDGLVLPPALREAIVRSEAVRLEVPLDERARAWFERMQAMKTSLAALIEAFKTSSLPPSPTHMQQWDSLELEGHTLDALAGIIDGYIDPNNAVDGTVVACPVVRLPSLDTDAVVQAVRDWLRGEPSAAPVG